MKDTKALKWINVLGFIFLLLASFLFSRTGMFQIANMPIFMPASYAFGIWGLIYILLAIWIVASFIVPEKTGYEEVGYWFVITMILTGLTILVPINWSVFFIIGALISSLVVYKKVQSAEGTSPYAIVPFSFLTGWLSVATIVNISLVLKNLGITEIFGLGEVQWTIILLAVGTIIAIWFAIKNEDFIYPLVFIWGYIAIAVQNKETVAIVRTALTMIFILTIMFVYNWYKRKLK